MAEAGNPAAARDVHQKERCCRQLAWLKRKTGDLTVSKSLLRPRKRHRKAALQWTLSLHNQVKLVKDTHPSAPRYMSMCACLEYGSCTYICF